MEIPRQPSLRVLLALGLFNLGVTTSQNEGVYAKQIDSGRVPVVAPLPEAYIEPEVEIRDKFTRPKIFDASNREDLELKRQMKTEARQPSAGKTEKTIKKDTVFARILRQLAAASEKVDKEKQIREPGPGNEIDKELSEGLFVAGVMGCGPNHEPPYEYFMACSPSLFVYNTNSSELVEYDITHDTRNPLVEKRLAERNLLPKRDFAKRIDQAWLDPNVGGFDLVRQSFQEMTGARVSVRVVLNDIVIKRYVDEVLGGVIVDMPWTMKAHAIYLDKETKITPMTFPKGEQKVDGTKLLQIIKAVADAGGKPYPVEQENNERKHFAIKALISASKKEYEANKAVFLTKLMVFVARELGTNIKTDPDISKIIKDLLGATLKEIPELILTGKELELGLPEVSRSRYIVDAAASVDGKEQPLRWGDTNSGDRCIISDVASGAYSAFYVEVPTDPNDRTWCAKAESEDLVTGYFRPIRRDFKKFVLGK